MKSFRRSLLLGTAAAVLASAGLLTGCATAGGGVSMAQALADAAGGVKALMAVVPAVEKAAPTLLPAATGAQVLQGLTLAQQLLANLDANGPPATAATVLQTVETAILQAVNALAAVTPAAAAAFPVLAPYVIIIQAAAALLPGLVAFINSVVPAHTASLPTGLPAPVMTPDAARAALGIPTV